MEIIAYLCTTKSAYGFQTRHYFRQALADLPHDAVALVRKPDADAAIAAITAERDAALNALHEATAALAGTSGTQSAPVRKLPASERGYAPGSLGTMRRANHYEIGLFKQYGPLEEAQLIRFISTFGMFDYITDAEQCIKDYFAQFEP